MYDFDKGLVLGLLCGLLLGLLLMGRAVGQYALEGMHAPKETLILQREAPTEFATRWKTCDERDPCEYPFGECRLRHMTLCMNAHAGTETP